MRGREVLFLGRRAAGAQPTIYRWNSGVLSTVAGPSTPVPGGTGTFKDTPSQFSQYVSYDAHSNNAFFSGSDSADKTGLYRHSVADGLSVLYNTTSDAPAGLGKFTYFGYSGASGDDLAFTGQTSLGSPQPSLFQRVNGVLSRVATIGESGPAGFRFMSFSQLSLDGGRLVWQDGGLVGVYTSFNGVISPVAVPGSIIEGRTVNSAHVVPYGRDGDRLAIDVQFTTGYQAIYIVTLPAPGALAVLVPTGLWAARRPG